MAGANLVDLSNRTTFEEVFRTHYSHLANFALKYVDDPDIAEEIVQEMFTSVWSKSDRIEISTSVKSYLFGAVRNACLNHLKHEKIKRAHEEHEKMRISHDEVDFVELDELQGAIDRAIAKLPEKCREIFMLSRFEEKKYQEIADELGLSIKTVENQMGRALKVMRTQLGRYLPVIAAMGLSTLVENNLWG